MYSMCTFYITLYSYENLHFKGLDLFHFYSNLVELKEIKGTTQKYYKQCRLHNINSAKYADNILFILYSWEEN